MRARAAQTRRGAIFDLGVGIRGWGCAGWGCWVGECGKRDGWTPGVDEVGMGLFKCRVLGRFFGASGAQSELGGVYWVLLFGGGIAEIGRQGGRC